MGELTAKNDEKICVPDKYGQGFRCANAFKEKIKLDN